MDSKQFTHLDESGSARMVDVAEKPVSRRSAVARAIVQMQASTASAVRNSQLAKGDVLQVARIAAIAAAKRTDELIPLCHTLPLDSISVAFDWHDERRLEITVEARATARTGVEMEALLAASIAALTVYDMCKAIDKAMHIEMVQLVSKTGGTQGDFKRNSSQEPA